MKRQKSTDKLSKLNHAYSPDQPFLSLYLDFFFDEPFSIYFCSRITGTDMIDTNQA